MYNGKQRRDIEKSLGLNKLYKKMTKEQQAEMKLRKRQAGKEIHAQNIQAIEQTKEKLMTEWYSKRLQFHSTYLNEEDAKIQADKDYEKRMSIVERKNTAKKIKKQSV